ncbi:hypothetical protein L195_g038281 [Trifolium pratense]|uniref:Uncharacterized protein n=1 Tax=Trifolium pratense TaxID=57577 RepID=A0A2K3LUN4_TRIPR|nr:hypothetical protein L195_g038281 [Trifolium pratense]
MSSAQARLRQAKNAKKKALEASGGSHSMPASSSIRKNPSPSLEILEAVAEKRTREEEMEDTNSSRQHRRIDDVDDFLNSTSGLHRRQPGQPTSQFVFPPIYAHDPIYDDQTEISISEPDTGILSSLGPTAIRAEIAKQSVAVFKLLEMVIFLNGPECHYLQERDAALAKLKEVSSQLSSSQAAFTEYQKQYALQLEVQESLKSAQAKLEEVTKERDASLARVEELEGQIRGLELKLKEHSKQVVADVVDEEEKVVDPAGVYAAFSRARLVQTIMDLNDNMIEAASSQFTNAVEQLKILNAGKDLTLEGIDEDKVVRDGAIVTPPDDEV